MAVEKTERYVAELKIEKIERTTNQDRQSASHGSVSDRVLDSVTKIIIKADTLERLVDKLGKHIEIIEED